MMAPTWNRSCCWGLLSTVLVLSAGAPVRAPQPSLFGVPDDLLYSSAVRLSYAEVATGPVVAAVSQSRGGILLDATGDGTADDLMVFNGFVNPNQANIDPNEVYLHSGGGTFTAMTEGALVGGVLRQAGV
eukprot:SAG22_NODE_413_length_10849_cov_6.078977_5_plen_130_part_00